jgi:hypothetical protein
MKYIGKEAMPVGITVIVPSRINKKTDCLLSVGVRRNLLIWKKGCSRRTFRLLIIEINEVCSCISCKMMRFQHLLICKSPKSSNGFNSSLFAVYIPQFDSFKHSSYNLGKNHLVLPLHFKTCACFLPSE